MNIPIREIFSKIISEDEFRKKYLMTFLDRFTYASVDLEKDLTNEKRRKIVTNLLEAFRFLMNKNEEKISISDLTTVGDFVNLDDGFEGLRKIVVSAGNYAEWIPVEPRRIYYALYSLLDNYYNVWNELDIYEREALLHINLMRIHPFEDGNKRTTRVILNANLISQNYPPVVITENETELYYRYLNEEDYEGFANFLRNKSLDELRNAIGLYKLEHNIPITDSLVESFGLSEYSQGLK